MLDLFRRKLFVKFELRKSLLKSHTKIKSIKLVQKYNAQFSLANLPKRSSKNKIQNRRITSGRNKNVLRRISSSRFVFRYKAHFSYLPGCRRAS